MSGLMENLFTPGIDSGDFYCSLKEPAQGGLILYFCTVKPSAMNFPFWVLFIIQVTRIKYLT